MFSFPDLLDFCPGDGPARVGALQAHPIFVDDHATDVALPGETPTDDEDIGNSHPAEDCHQHRAYLVFEGEEEHRHDQHAAAHGEQCLPAGISARLVNPPIIFRNQHVYAFVAILA
jgi:hypothetical protein